MTKKFLLTLILTISLLLNSCGSNSGSGTTETFSLDEKQFLHNLFLTEYLWYDEVASNIDYTQYEDPQLMINDLRINPPDEWSFTMAQQEYEDYANQKTAEFGFGYTAEFFCLSCTYPMLQYMVYSLEETIYLKLTGKLLQIL